MSEMVSDIFERLRLAQLNHDELRFGWLAEASDEIERLRARVAELEAEVAEAKLGDGAIASDNTLFRGNSVAHWWNKAQAREAAQEWRPIESAPRDCSVLVSDGKYVTKAYWNNDPRVWEADVAGCWTIYEPDDYFYAIHLNDNPPTHWLPLPAPPKEAT